MLLDDAKAAWPGLLADLKSAEAAVLAARLADSEESTDETRRTFLKALSVLAMSRTKVVDMQSFFVIMRAQPEPAYEAIVSTTAPTT